MILTYNGSGQIEPYHQEDMPFFKHCADGMIAVTQKYYESHLKSVIQAHGVEIIRVIKNGETP